MKRKTLPAETAGKLSFLEETLRGYRSVLLAYSGGVDSTFLLHVAARTLGERCVAVTVKSLFHEEEETADAARRAGEAGVPHEVLSVDLEKAGAGALSNPPDRCYHCKKLIFTTLRDKAESEGVDAVIEASHADDEGERRPGVRALRELGIGSPLLAAGLKKEEIRELSEYLGVKGSRRPSRPCLATRIPYGTAVTAAALARVARAEKILREEGFTAPRVRDYGDTARIEIRPGEIDRFGGEGLRRRVAKLLKDAGYTYVTLDLLGYRSGSMDEVLPPD